MTSFLDTERLSLRPLVEEDADGPYPDWFNDAETCAGNSHHVYPFSRSQAIDYIKSTRSDKSCVVLAVTLKSDKRHVGNVSLQHIHPLNRSAELAIIVGDKSCRGQGIGEEACRAIVAHGITALNLQRIACGTLATNHGMIAVARKLGFEQEGVLRQAAFKDGRYIDVLLYGLLAADFCAR